MSANDTITAPFTADQVQRLNEFQTGVQAGFGGHPYTCAHRGDGRHGRQGGDLGVLIATEAGWVCPHCTYTQRTASSSMLVTTMLLPSRQDGHAAERALRLQLLDLRTTAYRELAGARGVDVMLASLKRCRDAMTAPPAPASMWVVYERPRDYPGHFVARRFELRDGREWPTDEVLLASTLDELHDLAPPRLGRIPRDPSDDPVIVEMWL